MATTAPCARHVAGRIRGLAPAVALLLAALPVGAEAGAAAPLVAPHTTPAQDTAYLADVAKADPGLATYIQDRGDVALKALLTDGTAFCAFLRRGGGLDNALVAVAAGAQTVQAQTHLPASVATFNTMDAVALLTLCPSEQRLVPGPVRTKLQRLGTLLGTRRAG